MSHGTTLTVERVSLIPGGPDISVTAPSGATATVKLKDNGKGIESGTSEAKEIGVYKLSDGSKTIFVIAGSLDSPEFRDVLTTEDRLKPVAEATGGSIHWLVDNPTIEVRRVAAGTVDGGRIVDWAARQWRLYGQRHRPGALVAAHLDAADRAGGDHLGLAEGRGMTMSDLQTLRDRPIPNMDPLRQKRGLSQIPDRCHASAL